MIDKANRSESPLLIVEFYGGGIILQKRTMEGGYTAYPVNPFEFQDAISQVGIISPILPETAVFWGHHKGDDVVAWWKKPGMETILVESDVHVHTWRVPLPGMLVVLRGQELAVCAVRGKTRPDENAWIFNVPLPNTESAMRGGQVCLGSARLPEDAGINNLESVWNSYVGSTFNSHRADDKCTSYPADVRLLLMELHDKGVTEFPEEELCPSETITLKEWHQRCFT